MRVRPFSLPVVTKMTVEAAWIDENSHMNFGRYFDVFVEASNKISDALGFDDDEYIETGCTTFAGDYHVTFLEEARLGDRLSCISTVLSVSEKKLILRHDLVREGEGSAVATAEELVLSVSLETRRVCPFPEEMYAALLAAAPTKEVLETIPNSGRSISLTTPGPKRN